MYDGYLVIEQEVMYTNVFVPIEEGKVFKPFLKKIFYILLEFGL